MCLEYTRVLPAFSQGLIYDPSHNLSLIINKLNGMF